MKTITKTIKNGATLIYTQKKGDPFVSLTYGFQVGSANENDSNRGISHFIEHHCFNGSEKYTKEQFNFLPIEWGGYINANTCDSVTQYEVQALKEFYPSAIDLLSQLCFHPTFPDELLEKEKGIVLQEIEQSKDDVWRAAYKGLNSMFVDEKFQHPVLGYEEIIKNLSRNDLIAYYDNYYFPANCVVSVCGDVKIDDLIIEIEKYIPDIEGTIKQLEFNYEINSKLGIFYKEAISQNKLLKCYIIPKETKDNLIIAGDVLGGGLGARLVNELREKRSLCYQCGCSVSNHGDKYMFYVYISYGDDSKTGIIIDEIDRILAEVAIDLSEEEFNRTLSNIRGALYRSIETSKGISTSKPRKFFTGGEVDVDKTAKKFKKIKIEKVKKSIKKYLTKKNSFVCILKNKGTDNEQN